MNTKTEKPQKKTKKKNKNNQILINAHWRMKKLLILSVLCYIGYAKDRGRHSYIARNSLVLFCFPKFLRVSYFYMCADTHGAIADCEIDLVSCTTGLYFPHSSTFLIRSHMPWGARETLWLDLSVVHCPFVSKGLAF